jgi:glutamate synthase domain-containing protein 1
MAGMLAEMRERGPDSAGFGVYSAPDEGLVKITVQASDPENAFSALGEDLSRSIAAPVGIRCNSTHAVLTVPSDMAADAVATLQVERPDVRLIGVGEAIEIYKEVGDPAAVAERFGLARMSGSHGIGHTRMATESAVTTLGAHPFSTGLDQCLVHNGSLSNHNNVRRKLVREGMSFQTENDTEVAAAYISAHMKNGLSLGEALTESLADLDGFYTFVVGAKHGFGVLRDPLACKPAVLAETDRYVAFGTEFRALAGLPDIGAARVWEPEPATVYFWEG